MQPGVHRRRWSASSLSFFFLFVLFSFHSEGYKYTEGKRKRQTAPEAALVLRNTGELDLDNTSERICNCYILP